MPPRCGRFLTQLGCVRHVAGSCTGFPLRGRVSAGFATELLCSLRSPCLPPLVRVTRRSLRLRSAAFHRAPPAWPASRRRASPVSPTSARFSHYFPLLHVALRHVWVGLRGFRPNNPRLPLLADAARGSFHSPPSAPFFYRSICMRPASCRRACPRASGPALLGRSAWPRPLSVLLRAAAPCSAPLPSPCVARWTRPAWPLGVPPPLAALAPRPVVLPFRLAARSL